MAISGISGGYGVNYMQIGRAPVDTQDDLIKVRDKGLVAFARDAKKSAWEEKLKQWKAEIMSARGVSEESLAAMPAEQRTAELKAIDDLLKQKIKETMDHAKAQGKDKELSVPQFVDMSV